MTKTMTDWRHDAACRDEDPELFFPVSEMGPGAAQTEPRDRFLVAGEAWARCRAGEADPGRFGLTNTNEFGYWWIAGNMMRDAAALGNVELLPWDVWGGMPEPEEQIDAQRLALFDRLAELTRSPDIPLPELDKLCQDHRLRVPAVVHNAVRSREEAI